MKTRNDTGFTLLELLIAMGILAFILASFLVMIAVAGQLMVNNKRDLQRAYTKMAVMEIVRSNPGKTIVINEDEPKEIKGFFPDTWPDKDGTGPNARTVNSIKVNGTEILQAGAKDWKAVVSHQAGNRKVLVEVLGQIDEKDY